MIEQQIVYETLPKFCSYCKVFGHMVETCSKYAKSCGKAKGNGVGGNVETPFSPAEGNGGMGAVVFAEALLCVVA
uniref:Zinc knuckle CX2CX4HX4C domain-containing protein n=1 Tax=Salix viminalis TaxID=40686 RepID=A0A6N2K3L8_SALVM